jgi:hypothetical protein
LICDRHSYCELESIRRCAAEPITLEDLHARLINLKNGDRNELKRLAKLIVSDYVLAFQMLEAVDLVIRQPRPNGKILLQWPQPDHPAVATLLATIEEDVAGKGRSAISKPSLHSERRSRKTRFSRRLVGRALGCRR